MRKLLPSLDWAPVAVVTIVTLLAATVAAVMVAPRHPRPALVASALPSPSPPPVQATLPGPLPNGGAISLSAAGASVWALTDYQHLYRSTDHGEHWQLRSLPAGSGSSISFVGEADGWLLNPGSPAVQCQEAKPVLWRTSDGAASW